MIHARPASDKGGLRSQRYSEQVCGPTPGTNQHGLHTVSVGLGQRWSEEPKEEAA